MTRLLMVALDGATLDLLQPWMDEGKLPLLARLFREGCGGTLTSTLPWATPTAFASLATGTNPGQHGVYDFGTLLGEDYTSFVPTNRSHIRGRSLWGLLSAAGLSNAIINMPMTYPAEPVHGWLVAGIPYPGGSSRLSHPPELLEEMRDCGWDLARNASDDLGGSYQTYFDGLIDLVKTRSAATAWLLREKSPDFAAVHYLETDQVQHRYWQFLPGEPRHEPDHPLGPAILRLYQAVEEGLAEVVAAAGEGTTLCLMSDHGFGPTRRQVWLNNWLRANGFLTLKQSPGVRFKEVLYRIGLTPSALREAAPERLKLAILRFFERQKGRALAETLERDAAGMSRKGFFDYLTERVAIDFYDLNWQQTRAFSTGTTSVGYVWLNVRGRDPQGIVAPGDDYERTCAEIGDALRRWPLVGSVSRAGEIWQGEALDSAPDLVVQWADPATDARYFQTRFSSYHTSKPVPNDYAGHRRDGLFLFHGPHVRPGQRSDANLLDLTPTFLWLLDQAVPTYMDGIVLNECFTDERPVRFVEMEPFNSEANGDLTADDEEALRATLRGLGYME
jgi:predicted AlkP superfamily phosphohydrolase/phosphomutase